MPDSFLSKKRFWVLDRLLCWGAQVKRNTEPSFDFSFDFNKYVFSVDFLRNVQAKKALLLVLVCSKWSQIPKHENHLKREREIHKKDSPITN